MDAAHLSQESPDHLICVKVEVDEKPVTLEHVSFQRCNMEQEAKKKNGGVRGLSWRKEEIRHLLEIWGDEKMQRLLRQSHRNLENYQDISRELMARGINRTAEECRTKTKTLRLEYRRVLAHNSGSGNKRADCPFFEELNRILKGDGRVMPNRVGKNLKYKPSSPFPGISVAAAASMPNRAQPVFGRSIGEGLVTADISRLRDYSSTGSEPEVLSEVAVSVGNEDDETQIEGQIVALEELSAPLNGHEASAGGEALEERPVVTTEDSSAESSPSPERRLAKARKKRRRVSELRSVAERMMEHATFLLRQELEARRREHRWEVEVQRREELERQRRDEQDRREREALQECLRRNCAVLESAVEAFKCFLSQQQPDPEAACNPSLAALDPRP